MNIVMLTSLIMLATLSGSTQACAPKWHSNRFIRIMGRYYVRSTSEYNTYYRFTAREVRCEPTGPDDVFRPYLRNNGDDIERTGLSYMFQLFARDNVDEVWIDTVNCVSAKVIKPLGYPVAAIRNVDCNKQLNVFCYKK